MDIKELAKFTKSLTLGDQKTKNKKTKNNNPETKLLNDLLNVLLFVEVAFLYIFMYNTFLYYCK